MCRLGLYITFLDHILKVACVVLVSQVLLGIIYLALGCDEIYNLHHHMGKKIQLLLQSILPYLTVFLAAIYRPIDPDLGWHLKYGEYFFKNLKILKENIFSTEMPGFIWTNISWGADLAYYAFYRLGGFFGLTLGGAAVVVLTFFFFAKAFKLDYWEKAIIFPIVLFLMNPVNANSFRGQQLSLLFLGILAYLFTRFESERGKSLYFVPLLFLIWANTHGLFVLGLGVFGLWEGFFLLSEYVEEKKINILFPYLKHFFAVTLAAIFATLLHPYGIKIYEDALLHFNDPLLKKIAEYLPAVELSQQWMNLVFTAVFAGIGIAGYVISGTWKKKIPQIGVFAVLYFLSTWVRRYSWAMYYLVMPFLKAPAGFIRPDNKKSIFYGATLLFTVYIIVILMIKQPYDQFMKMDWNTYCRIFGRCSPQAADALKDYYVEGKTMTLYNWGGWLIWNYPEMKPSADGRMHLWRDDNGFSAFEQDYYIEQNVKDVHESKYDVVYTAKYKPIYNRLLELAKEKKWNLVYKDSTTAIFTRVK